MKNNILEKIKNLPEKTKLASVIGICAIIIFAFILYLEKEEKAYVQASENSYQMAFCELVDYVQNVEIYLSKSLVSSSPEHGAETLTRVWREANLAQSYLARLPISSNELENTQKFLNQVSDYTYSLSNKNIQDEKLTQEDLEQLTKLHTYSQELANTLEQLSVDLNNGRIKWSDLTKEKSSIFAQEVSNLSKDSFGSVEENFHEYAGLIYDGAFSEHITTQEKVGLTGEEISQEEAEKVAREYLTGEEIREVSFNGFAENANIPAYEFYAKINRMGKEENINISVSKKGGHIIFANLDREIGAEILSQEDAEEIGRKFLEARGIKQMETTYYVKQSGIVTINYAYYQMVNDEKVTMYPDLVKVKVALDNGEILGMETTGYLNSHQERNLASIKISKETAKQAINPNLEIISEGLAVIPTEWKTEIFCYEFRGKIQDREFLIYINVENGKEEDILIILNTENGILTQ